MVLPVTIIPEGPLMIPEWAGRVGLLTEPLV